MLFLTDEMGEGRECAWETYRQRKMGGSTKFKTILKMGRVALKLLLMPFKMEKARRYSFYTESKFKRYLQNNLKSKCRLEAVDAFWGLSLSYEEV